MERCAGYLTWPPAFEGRIIVAFPTVTLVSPLVFSPMFYVNTVLAIINIFPYYLAPVPTRVSMDDKPAELDGILPEEAIITHPVGEKDTHQTFSLYANVIVTLNTNCSAKVIISMRTQGSPCVDTGVINPPTRRQGEPDSFHLQRLTPQAKKLIIVQGPTTIWPMESPSATSSQYRGQLPLISSFFLSSSILAISSSVYLYGLTMSSYFPLLTVA